MIIPGQRHCVTNESPPAWARVPLTMRPRLARVSGFAILFCSLHLHVFAASYDDWFFTADEVEAAHQYQEYYGERIRNPLPARACLFGKKEFTAAYRSTQLLVPCRFISEIARHLKEMLVVGAAKYLFPLDADHAHLAVPAKLWETQYSKLPAEQVLFALMRDPELVALYHTAEHLRVSDPTTGKVNSEAKAWKDKRNVLAFFDGRPIRILPPHPAGHGVGMPAAYNAYGGFNFLANPRGELFIFVQNKVVTFDLSLEPEAETERSYPDRQLLRTKP